MRLYAINNLRPTGWPARAAVSAVAHPRRIIAIKSPYTCVYIYIHKIYLFTYIYIYINATPHTSTRAVYCAGFNGGFFRDRTNLMGYGDALFIKCRPPLGTPRHGRPLVVHAGPYTQVYRSVFTVYAVYLCTRVSAGAAAAVIRVCSGGVRAWKTFLTVYNDGERGENNARRAEV